MLTCEEIVARVAIISQQITRETYFAVAQQIHPRILHVETPHLPIESRSSIAAWREYMRGQHWPTDDWTDMVVLNVTLWQWRAFATRWNDAYNETRGTLPSRCPHLKSIYQHCEICDE